VAADLADPTELGEEVIDSLEQVPAFGHRVSSLPIRFQRLQ
jgi:hypothetical protein